MQPMAEQHRAGPGRRLLQRQDRAHHRRLQRPAAFTTVGRGCWRVTFPSTLPAIPISSCKTCRAQSSVVAANYVYHLAKPDGLTMVMPLNSLHLDQLVGRPEVKYDLRKFAYIGSQEKTPTMMYFRADSPIKSLGDIIQAKEPPKCGSSGTTQHSLYYVEAAQRSIQGQDHQHKRLSGRQRNRPGRRARRTGLPSNGRAAALWPRALRRLAQAKGFDRHIFQGGPKRDARLAEVPTLFELLDQYKSPAIMRSLTRVILAAGEMGRPMMAGPGVSA